MNKTCIKCKETKPLAEFNKRIVSKDGYDPKCKICSRLLCRKYAASRRSKKAEYMREYRKTENGKKAQEKISNSDKFKNRMKNWRQKNHEKIKEKSKQWIENNREKYNEYRKRYDSSEKRKSYKREQYQKNKVQNNISKAIRDSLKDGKNGRHWENIVGYNCNELKSHLEKQFQPGMSWENYGKWHIDHVIPISFFRYSNTDDVEFKMCWRLENLQPLWATENEKKGNKIVYSLLKEKYETL
jgi:hypothetical protein